MIQRHKYDVLFYVKRILHLVRTYLQSDKVEGPNLSKPVMVSIHPVRRTISE